MFPLLFTKTTFPLMIPLYRILTIFCLLLSPVIASAQNDFWEPLNGPNGIQFISNIASNAAETLLLVTNKYVYRSTDNGISWIDCSDGLPSDLYYKDLLVSPGGEFYLMLDYGDGVFRYMPTTDSWTPIQLGWSYPDGLDIDSQGRLWVSKNTSVNKIYYSTNQGQSFQEVPLDGIVQGGFIDLAIFNDDHNLIALNYVAYHFSIDGTTQLVLNGGGAIKFVDYNPNTGTAFSADSEGFKRSPDGGLNWQIAELVPNQQNQPEIQKMTFEQGGKIWAHTENEMYWSEDDGVTWTKFAPFSNLGALFQANDSWFNVTCSLLRTNDSGATWSDLTESLQAPIVYDIKKDGSGTLYALVCRKDTYIYVKSNDEGQTWSDLIIVDSVATYVTSLAVRPDGMMMSIGDNDKFYRSMNNGINWEMINAGSQSEIPSDNFQFYTDFHGAFYLFEYYGSVWKSINNGDSWQPLQFWSDDFYEEPGFHPNGDIFTTDFSTPMVYVAAENTTKNLEVSGQPFFSAGEIHCTIRGVSFMSTASPASIDFCLYRILPDGNYAPEPIPFFHGFFQIIDITSNSEGDVFVATTDLVYKSEDDGGTWESIAALPDGRYLWTLYIAPDQYMYAGFHGDVIHRSALPTAQSNFILGKVWLDTDGDCAYNAGEQLLTSTAVTATGNGDYTSFSGYNGNFTLSAPSGAFSLNVQPPNALYEACFTDLPVTLDGPNDSATVDLPLKVVAQCPYLSVNLTTPILRRCFDVTYTVRYKNEGTATATGAYVEVLLDSFYLFQSSSLPLNSQNGFSYTFQVGDLPPGQSGSFNVTVKVSCDAPMGQIHCIAAHIYPDQLCLPSLQPRAVYQECRENIGSFDPNDKRAFVSGQEEPGHVRPDTDIEYLIRFQNTGTDTAFRVVVEDRLSTLLDLASVTPLVASHPFAMEVRDQRVLRFVFDNILLPDSNINEAASHGFIKLRVSQMPGVALGSVIKNEADIFFDFNAPVNTNTSTLVVGTVGTKQEPGNPYHVTAYPNPFGESITFEITGPVLPGNATMRLFDALGRQVRREEFAGEIFVIQRHTLETGLYYFLIESDGKRIGAGKVEAK